MDWLETWAMLRVFYEFGIPLLFVAFFVLVFAAIKIFQIFDWLKGKKQD